MANAFPKLGRREFLASAAGLAAAQGLMPMHALGGILGSSRYVRYREEDAHFFLHVYMANGLDFHTLFDSRPLEMTAAKLIHDPMGNEPTLWQGSNGGKTWATALTAPLAKYRDRFSVLNGVVMLPDFNGHFENSNYTHTGNAFGGDALYPMVRESSKHGTVLDAVGNSYVFANINNLNGTMVVSPESLQKLKTKLTTAASLAPSSKVFKYVVDSYVRSSQSGGFFSQGSRAMAQGLLDSPVAIKRLQKLNPVGEIPDADEKFLRTVCEMFKAGVTQSAVYNPTVGGTGLDMHSPESTKTAKDVVGPLAERIAKVFEILATTRFDEDTSMLDHTTILVSTEFGRTMRQDGLAINNTGTDHNQFANSMLLGGRGIKGGLVIGGTDFRTSTEKLSGAHKRVDAKLVNVIGAPYDPATGLPRSDLPETYKITDYLSYASVGNTIAELFGVPTEKRWVAGRNLPAAASIKPLLV